MTELLEQAFAAAAKLPEADQREVARAVFNRVGWWIVGEPRLRPGTQFFAVKIDAAQVAVATSTT